jgi:hypothetical protein
MEKITEAKKKKMERVRNGGYPSTSNGGLHKDRGDLLQKENCGCKKPKSPINTRDFEMSTKLPVIIQKKQKLKEFGKTAKIRIARQGELKDCEEWRCKNPTPPRTPRDLNRSRMNTKLPSIFKK